MIAPSAAPIPVLCEVRYVQMWAPGRIVVHEFTARAATGVILGRLVVNGCDPDEAGGQVLPPWTIRTVSVRHDHQRRGIATALLGAARRVLPAVHHSPYLARDTRTTDQPTTDSRAGGARLGARL